LEGWEVEQEPSTVTGGAVARRVLKLKGSEEARREERTTAEKKGEMSALIHRTTGLGGIDVCVGHLD